MSYSTVADVRLVLVGVDNSPATDYDLTANLLSNDQVEAEIANADAQIDAALADRYTVPFPTPVPALIKSISIDISAYLCDLRFRGAREHASDLSPFIQRYQRAVQMLTALSEGTATLPNVEIPVDGSGIAINPYEGYLMKTKDIFTRWPEGTIRDD